MLYHFVVPASERGRSLEGCVREQVPTCTRAVFYKMLRKKDVKVNGKRVSVNCMLHGGESIDLYLPFEENSLAEIEEVAKTNGRRDGKVTPYRIVYEDNALLVVSKDPGISVQADSSGESCLLDLLRISYPQCQLCHRLDRNTGGLLLVGKTEAIAAFWQDMFREHRLEKYYRCLVWGKVPSDPSDDWQRKVAWHFKDARKSRVLIYDEPRAHCKEIRTAYRVISYDPTTHVSHLEVRLYTGRTHQIRAHLAHLGHPLLGDGKYGRNEINKRFPYKYQALWASRLSLPANVCRRFAETCPEWQGGAQALDWEDLPAYV